MEKNEKIFVQIASYRDPELLPTIRDCIEKSNHPENLVFSIAWQHSTDDLWDNLDEFKSDERFRIIDIDYRESKGACWSRNLLQQQYQGEDYTLQLDSHHRFIENWDDELINMLKSLQSEGYPKPILTGYASSYDPDNDPLGRINIPWKMNFSRFGPEGVVHFLPANIENYKTLTKPIRARFYSAHFAFTIGVFVKEVPHDPNYYFYGEEISISVRAFTCGYDLFHPHKCLIWHHYGRKGFVKHWDDDKSWHIKNESSFLRNRKLFGIDGVVNDIDFDVYGFGNIRTLNDYEKYSGVLFSRRSVQQYTLNFKSPPNPIYNDDEYDGSFIRLFEYCIDIKPEEVPESDYEYWVVAFHDEKNGTMFREDVKGDELKKIMKGTDNFFNIWRKFEITKMPSYWVVWPYSTSKGWCNRLSKTV